MKALADKQLAEWAEFANKQANDWRQIVQGRDETIAALNERIEELTSARASDDEQPPSKSVSTRERESLLKLVIGMAVRGYGYNPAATRSEQPQTIADDLVQIGLSLDVDTVRKWMKEGAELIPSESPARAKKFTRTR